ncbi:MerR family transcriptional regulator [Ruania albidiflava]|uniref:MerR family transcriptional regulator n=1 Tax=Ruania albidiflava TaxID=366586 RepID=UPI0003B37B62|nr:MerR family transcriptional regulator [Ruania albidiflava]
MLIGEVARRSGVSPRMLRHYDRLGLVRPTGRTTGGYRVYAESDLRRILHVEMLRSLGLSLEQARDALEDPAAAPAELVAELAARTRARIAVEQELLDRLEQVRADKPQEWTDVLRTTALLRSVASADPNRRARAVLAAATSAASTGSGQPAPDALADAVLAEAETNVAGTLRWALARGGDQAVDRLAAGLGSTDPDVRRRAAEALAEIGTDRAAGALREALSHPDERVRYRAALALGRGGEAAALPVLLQMVVAGRTDVEAAEALGALAADQQQRGVILAAIADLLRDAGTPPAARSRLTQALGELPGAATERLLAELTSDPQPDVARTATYLSNR